MDIGPILQIQSASLCCSAVSAKAFSTFCNRLCNPASFPDMLRYLDALGQIAQNWIIDALA